MDGLIPIMCAAALSLFYSGEITSVNQLQVVSSTFPAEVPNNGFILSKQPELWQMGVTLNKSDTQRSTSGIAFFSEMGPVRWKKGQKMTVTVAACDDDGMLSSLQNWNAFAPPSR
jgi:hypothetical protein